MKGFYTRNETCRAPGCTRFSGSRISGMCKQCTKAARDRTTDGVLTGSKPKLTPEQQVEVRRMYAGLLSKREIARHFGVDSNTIAKYLKADR